MKLQQLRIHNIASIEDAVIDFESQPLVNSEVFLITGKTGAGKSTLLDAICLALYGNTPRLKNTLIQGEVKDMDKTFRTDDPRNLMRKNTGEASVILTFTGSNQVAYEAVWAVTRARKRPTGNLQVVEWSLKNLHTKESLQKKREIEAEILAAIGLDFNQFCRTTMLAQGEFTRFLNSKDEEKAVILEKITGVDVYSKIGSKVYELTRGKESEYLSAKEKTEKVSILSEEEVKIKETEVFQLNKEIEQCRVEKEIQSQKLVWLKGEVELLRKIDCAEKESRSATSVVEGEEFKRKEGLIADWEQTIEARQWLLNRDSYLSEQQILSVDLEKLTERYVQVKAGVKGHDSVLKDTERSLQALKEYLLKHADKASVFEHVQTIVADLNILIEGRKKIDETEKQIGVKKAFLKDKIQTVFEDALSAYEKSKGNYDSLFLTLQQSEEELMALGLSDLRKKKEGDVLLLNNIRSASLSIQTYHTEKIRVEEEKQSLDALLVSIEKMLREEEKLQEKVKEAKIRRDITWELLEAQKRTVDDWAKSIRFKLKVGEVCPVCCQELKVVLPNEDDLALLYKKAEDNFRKDDSNYEDKVHDLNVLSAQIRTHRELYQRNRKKLDEDRTLLDYTGKARQACEACGVLFVDETTLSLLDELEKKVRAGIQVLDGKIQNGEDFEKGVKQKRAMVEVARKEYEQSKKVFDEAKDKQQQCANEIAIDVQLVDSKKADMEDAESRISQWVDNYSWNADWKTSTEVFKKELLKVSGEYLQKRLEKEKLTADLQHGNEIYQQELELLKTILQIKPDWEALQVGVIMQAPNLLAEINRLLGDVRKITDKLATLQQNLKVVVRQLQEFYDSNPTFDVVRLKELAAFKQTAVSVLKQEVEQKRNDARDKQTTWNLFVSEQKKHNEKRPVLIEGESMETLQESMQHLDVQWKTLNEKRMFMEMLLKQNQENLEVLGKLLEEVKAKKVEYDKWSRINQLIGDSSGSKFRKIAQSYVLTSLIHSANAYMKTLTDRYVLKVIPGTFVILLEDAYQGYVSRSATTISGGETFLVSLSLALALSDIGQRLAVDTLFIDEGFGTLSGEPLQNAIETLRSLHSKAGRKVGIISHVEELQERIPVQIQVIQEGNNSSSEVRVVAN